MKQGFRIGLESRVVVRCTLSLGKLGWWWVECTRECNAPPSILFSLNTSGCVAVKMTDAVAPA